MESAHLYIMISFLLRPINGEDSF